jgi:hypothetical protein
MTMTCLTCDACRSVRQFKSWVSLRRNLQSFCTKVEVRSHSEGEIESNSSIATLRSLYTAKFHHEVCYLCSPCCRRCRLCPRLPKDDFHCLEHGVRRRIGSPTSAWLFWYATAWCWIVHWNKLNEFPQLSFCLVCYQIPWDLLLMATKRNLTASDMLKSSTDALPCLPLLDTSSKKPVSVCQEPLIIPELPSPPSPTDLPPSRPSRPVDSSSSFSLLVA